MANGTEMINYTRSDAAAVIQASEKIKEHEHRIDRLEKAAIWIAALLIATLASSVTTLAVTLAKR